MTAQPGTAAPTTGTWVVSDSRTRVGFTVANLGRPVHGTVACSHGEVRIAEDGTPRSVWAELDLDSLDTGIARRDTDLRKPRLLDIDRAPVMTWRAQRFTREGADWVGEGRLGVRGTSAPLSVRGSVEAGPGGGWLRVRASALLDRTAVGIRAPRVLIGRSILIDVDAWLVRG